MHGALNAVIPANTAQAWSAALLAEAPTAKETPFAVMQLTRLTGDRFRDLSEKSRHRAATWLATTNAPAHYAEHVRRGGELEAEDQRTVFGEALLRGLRLDS